MQIEVFFNITRSGFIKENLIFYTVLFKMFMQRATRLDLQFLRDVQFIFRVTKVCWVTQLNFKPFLHSWNAWHSLRPFCNYISGLKRLLLPFLSLPVSVWYLPALGDLFSVFDYRSILDELFPCCPHQINLEGKIWCKKISLNRRLIAIRYWQVSFIAAWSLPHFSSELKSHFSSEVENLLPLFVEWDDRWYSPKSPS